MHDFIRLSIIRKHASSSSSSFNSQQRWWQTNSINRPAIRFLTGLYARCKRTYAILRGHVFHESEIAYKEEISLVCCWWCTDVSDSFPQMQRRARKARITSTHASHALCFAIESPLLLCSDHCKYDRIGSYKQYISYVSHSTKYARTEQHAVSILFFSSLRCYTDVAVVAGKRPSR